MSNIVADQLQGILTVNQHLTDDWRQTIIDIILEINRLEAEIVHHKRIIQQGNNYVKRLQSDLEAYQAGTIKLYERLDKLEG